MKNYNVITESGLVVFDGKKTDCNAYLKQALKKGSPIGFLRIVEDKTAKNKRERL